MRRVPKALGVAVKLFTFVDLIDPDSKEIFSVRARLTLLTTEDGGRQSGISSRYRPNHNFGDPDGREMYIGQIEFSDREFIEPGETNEVTVNFIPGRGLSEKLKVGREWRIQEASRLVGNATVLELLNDT